MANNNSDYNKPFTDIFELLPNVFKTDVNKALADNAFNRYLTKPEIKNVVGVIGNVDLDQRITEIDPHRQAFQLQPLIYNKIATVDHISSFKDVLRESVRLGVNSDRMDEWANALQFNFIPPVDLDKVLNFRDYYWLSETTPQYITIRNRLLQLCTVIEQAYDDNTGLQDLVTLYLAEPAGPSKDALANQINVIYPGFVLIVEEKEFIQLNDPLNQTNTDGWDAHDWDPLFQGDWDDPLDGMEIIGLTASSFIIQGDVAALFNLEPLFTFQTVQSTFNNGLYQVAIAIYDNITNTTEVFVMGGGVNTAIVDGLLGVSLYDSDGLDPFVTGNWDQNDGSVPVVIPNPNNFILQSDPWSSQNNWVHISDVPGGINLSLVKQAEQPILEYNAFIVLNEWSFTKHNWTYKGNDGIFNPVEFVPSNEEIFASEDQTYPVVSIDLLADTVDIDVAVFPNALTDLTIGAEFSIEFVNTLSFKYYTVVSLNQVGDILTITLDQPLPGDANAPQSRVHGLRYTSQGDDWKGFFHHWVHTGINFPVPVNRQQINDNLIIDDPSYLAESELFEATGVTTLTYTLTSLTYNPGSDEVRVYVNGTRQYGTYNEVPTGDAIVFYQGIGYGEIRIDVGPAAALDARRANVQLRTSTSISYVPIFDSLVEYRLVEQQKTADSQYPLFDMFNLDGTSAFLASPLWKFLESTSYLVNPLVNKRIVLDGTTYSFEQLLLEVDDGRMFAYSEFDDPTDAEATLHTVWRRGLNNEEYVPEYVDVNRNPLTVGDPAGDWEVPDQMFNNVEHENRRILTSVDLNQHFKSVVAAQINPPGFNDDEQTRWRVLLNPNYGLGGSVKEYNDGFDTFLSSTFVNNVTVASLLEFAMIRYDGQLNIIRDYFEEDIVTLIVDTSDAAIINLQDTINESLIDRFENNGARDNVFGDSTTYDEETQMGIRNWVPTLPFVKLIEAVIPQLTIDESIGLIELLHHDGHISTPAFKNTVESQMVGAILKQPNTDSGLLSARLDPSLAPKGQMYYATDTRQLFKHNIISKGSIAPSGQPDGVFWYDTNTNQLREQVSGIFVVALDQEASWVNLQLTTMYARVLFEIEQRLYSVVPTGLNYDITQVQSDSEYLLNENKQFVKFTKTYNIVNPLASDYDATNAFTWNYSSVDINDYDIAVGNTPIEWVTQPPARWYDIYEGVYGTRLPHIEPWVLHGYELEPTWWNSTYAGTTRRWSTLMWNNIVSGIVPIGNELPNGGVSTGAPAETTIYNALSVNVTNNTTVEGGYGPDDLFPPFYNSSVPADDAIAAQSGIMLLNAPAPGDADDSYTFGQNGPIEDAWRRSIIFNYNLAEIAYITQPIRFIHFSLGNNLSVVDGLTIDTDLNKVFSHKDINFHGDIVNGQPISVDGINQWYVDYLRFNALDANTSDFKSLWKDWTPRLSYQTGAFLDVNAIRMFTDSQYLDESDVDIITKRTPGFEDHYIDSLNTVVSEVGANRLLNGIRIPINKGIDWKFRITTPNPSTESIKLYTVNTAVTIGSFNILNGSSTTDAWDHFQLDKSSVIEFVPNNIVSDLGVNYEGIQGLVNLIDGYMAYLQDAGFNFNTLQYSEIDTEFGRTINWQLETERLIDRIYTGMSSDQLPVEFLGLWNYAFADTLNNNFIVTGNNPISISNDDAVQMSTTGVLPVPFTKDAIYYVVNTTSTTFELSATLNGAPITLITSGQGTHSVGMHRVAVATPATLHEVNPFRNIAFFDNEVGVISDLHKGPFIDIRNQQGIYDQFGRALDKHHIKVFRSDKSGRITIDRNIPNDVITATSARDNIHIGGMHLFVDGYEHAILFNSKTIEGNLLFDEFLGSSIRKITMNFLRQSEQTFRPNVGGHYLLDDNIHQNMEAAADEIQMLFDTNVANEESEAIKSARKIIGFELKDYFNDMGITPKSQLLFHRGAIQHKGSTNAVKAFINSKQFIDANVDEFWAYKLAEYGDDRVRVHPEVLLNSQDTQIDKLMLHYGTDDTSTPHNFIRVELTDDSRWYNQPGQLSEIFSNEPNLHFEAEVTDSVSFTDVDVNGGYIKLPTICDAVNVIAQQENQTLQFISNAVGPFIASLNVAFLPNADSLEILIKRGGTFIHQTDLTESIDGLSVIINTYTDETGAISDIAVGDIITIGVRNAKLKEGVHYRRVNSTLIHFSTNPLALLTDYTAYCLNPAKTKLNPVKLIDYKSDTNIQNIPVWDPARGHHYHNAEHVVQYQGTDPAYYTSALVDPANLIEDTLFPIEPKIDNNKSWMESNVGQVWWDVAKRGYINYYDPAIIPIVDDRVSGWGKLADWAKIELFEWVKSPVVPVEYDQYVIDQQSAGEFISGSARQTLYTRTRDVGGTELFTNPWVELSDIIVHFDVALESSTVSVLNIIDNGETVNIYRNGKFDSQDVVILGVVNIPTSMNEEDTMTVIQPIHVPTENELEFDPEVEDDITINIQYKFDYKFTQVDRISANGLDTDSTYYFWASNTATNHSSLILSSAERQLANIPIPFVLFQNLLGSTIDLPDRYDQSIFRGMVNMITSDNRFKLRYTKDFTLRDDYEDAKFGLKSQHVDWKLIRERQKFNIDRVLWDKLTEALSGRTLVESGVTPEPVPSLNRVLYDDTYNTTFRFGMRDGQALVDKQRGIQTVLATISDPNFDLFPIDREAFLLANPFSDSDGIEDSMDTIYTTFLPEHINRIWFAALHDGLADNIKYTDIFKTSWIQLDGVRLLDTTGVLV